MRDVFRSHRGRSAKSDSDPSAALLTALELVHTGLRLSRSTTPSSEYSIKSPNEVAEPPTVLITPELATIDTITPSIFKTYDIAVKIFSYLLPPPRPDPQWEWHNYLYRGEYGSRGRLWDAMRELRQFATVNRAFYAAVTPTVFHTIELVRKGQLPRLLSLLRDEKHRHLRPLIKNLHIYDLSSKYFRVSSLIDHPLHRVELEVWHQLISPNEAALFFPEVRAVNLLAGALVDSSFLSTLPQLEVLRIGRDALPVAEENDHWPVLSMRLNELCIFEDAGMHDYRENSESHMLDARGRVSTGGWFSASQTLAGLSVLRIDIGRIWQLWDLEIIVTKCQQLIELHVEFGDGYSRLWCSCDLDGPKLRLSNNHLQIIHVYPWKHLGEHLNFLCELLQESDLPRLHTVNLSVKNLETMPDDSSWKERWRRSRLWQLPQSVTAGIKNLNIDGGLWPIFEARDPLQGLNELEQDAVNAIVNFMGFQDKLDRVQVKPLLSTYTMPPSMFVDDRHHRVATVHHTRA